MLIFQGQSEGQVSYNALSFETSFERSLDLFFLNFCPSLSCILGENSPNSIVKLFGRDACNSVSHIVQIEFI